MHTLPEYMIKISACYAAVYLFYWLVLRRLTNYKSNRFYLLATALLAFIFRLKSNSSHERLLSSSLGTL